MATATRQEAEAVLGQGAILERQSAATTDQAKSVAEQAVASAQQAAAVTEQLDLTRAGLEVTRQSLRASVQPWITVGETESFAGTKLLAGTFHSGGALPVLVHDVKGSVMASILIRNVGVGLAIIDPQKSHLRGWQDPRSDNPDQTMQFGSGTIRNPVLPPGERARIEFSVDLARWQTNWKAITGQEFGSGLQARLQFDVTYNDVLGSNMTLVRRYVLEDKPGQWAPYQIDYFSPVNSTSATLTTRFR
ncbi:MAG: hypothetical protein ACRDWV_02360 [Acidimicrobiales bacterium]